MVDVANPANPMLLGQLPLPGSGYAWAVALQGNYAYLAAESEGLQIVNVSNPGNPSLVGGGFKPAGVSGLGRGCRGELRLPGGRGQRRARGEHIRPRSPV